MDYIILLLILLLDIFFWLIIATVIVSWLVVFGVLNTRNKWVDKGCRLLNLVTDPPTRILRRYVPPIGGMDLTPMILIFGIMILKSLLIGML